MNYPTVDQTRNFVECASKTLPDGLYFDSATEEAFMTTGLLAYLVGESADTIDEFIESKTFAQNSVEMAEVQTVTGLKTVALHPESTILTVIKEYGPYKDLSDDLDWFEFADLINNLAELATVSIVEPVFEVNQQQWTLYEWMAWHCEIVLEAKLFNKFKSKVHRLYKDTYGHDPTTAYRKQAKNPRQVAKLQVYTPTEFSVLQVCYMKTLMEVRCY